MSDINFEKDDQATQEMLAMMGELPDDQAMMPIDLMDLDMDDFLNTLDDMPTDIDDTIDIASTAEPSDLPDTDTMDLDDIEALMAQMDSEIEPMNDMDEPSTELETQNTHQVEMITDETSADDMAQMHAMKESEKALPPEEIPSNLASKDIDLDNIDFNDIDDLSDIDLSMEQVSSIDSSELTDITDMHSDLPSTEEVSAEMPFELADIDDIDAMMAQFDLPTAEPDAAQGELQEDALEAIPETEYLETAEDVSLEMADMDDIDAMLALTAPIEDIDIDSESEPDLEPAADTTHELTAQVDDSMNMDEDLELPSAEPDSEAADDNAAEISDIDNIDEFSLTDDSEEAMSEDIATELEDSIINDKVSTDKDMDSVDNNPMIAQASQSVANMEEAIEIDQEIQQIAKQVLNTAQEATHLALATSKKAHESAEKIQQAIEATFVAAERAFEAAKNAGYSVDLSELETQLTPSEIDERLREIQEKNKTLKAVNQILKAKISDLND